MQEPLADTTNQDWCFIPTEDDYYRIESRNSGQIIMADWEPNEPNAGKNVYQWWYWGGQQQAWRLEFTAQAPPTESRPAECMGFPPNTFFHIINEHSGRSLRQRSNSDLNVVQSDILAGNLDNWRMVAAGNGHYMIMNQISGLALSRK